MGKLRVCRVTVAFPQVEDANGTCARTRLMDLTWSRDCAKIFCTGVVRDLSRLYLDWTGRVISVGRRCYWERRIGWPFLVKENRLKRRKIV